MNRPMSDLANHWKNAKVIAKIPDDEITSVSFSELIKKGFVE